MFIRLGPTGSLIKGDIFDVNKQTMQRALRDYDPQLYVKWNPTKLRGYGCWELRRRPETKSVVDMATYQGDTYLKIDYYETSINHVKDFAFLNYSMIEWLKKSDTWKLFNYDASRSERTDRFVSHMQEAKQKHTDETKSAARKEMIYGIMQDKKVIKDFRERIQSGVNPALLGKYWGNQPQ